MYRALFPRVGYVGEKGHDRRLPATSPVVYEIGCQKHVQSYYVSYFYGDTCE